MTSNPSASPVSLSDVVARAAASVAATGVEVVQEPSEACRVSAESALLQLAIEHLLLLVIEQSGKPTNIRLRTELQGDEVSAIITREPGAAGKAPHDPTKVAARLYTARSLVGRFNGAITVQAGMCRLTLPLAAD